VVFVGINPSLTSATVRHHFARPGNRFWPVLHRAGFTPRQLRPDEDRLLLDFGVGVTNLVDRATRSASELQPREYEEGARRLARKMRRIRPEVVAVVGVDAFRRGFGQKAAAVGRQEITIGGRPTWVLPNPSGLNAHYQMPDLIHLYRALHAHLSWDR